MNSQATGSAAFGRRRMLSLLLFLIANGLFIFKYGSERLPGSLWVVVCVIYVLVSVFLLAFHRRNFGGRERTLLIFARIVIGLVVVGAIVILALVDPQKIAVGRYPALQEWFARFLSGQYPYAPNANISGFPFLFMLAVPFYLLGDLGYLQIAAFLLFVYLLWHSSTATETFVRVVLLLVISPLFAYEVVVRSELFSNMTVLLALFVLIKETYKPDWRYIVPVGILTGFILSTRGIVIIPYLFLLGYMIGTRRRRVSFFVCISVLGFVLTLVPFYVWNPDHFLSRGPFAVQSSYMETWLLGLILLVVAAGAYFVRRFIDLILYSGYVLFAVIALAFILAVANFGFSAATVGDRFDISYFAFAQPFLLFSLLQPDRD